MSLELKKIKWTNKNWDFDFPMKGRIYLEGRFIDFDRVFYIQNFKDKIGGDIEIQKGVFYLMWTCNNGSRYLSRRNMKEFTTLEEAKEAAQKKCEEMVNEKFLKYFDMPPKRKVLVEKHKRRKPRKNKRRPQMPEVFRRGPNRYWGFTVEG